MQVDVIVSIYAEKIHYTNQSIPGENIKNIPSDYEEVKYNRDLEKKGSEEQGVIKKII